MHVCFLYELGLDFRYSDGHLWLYRVGQRSWGEAEVLVQRSMSPKGQDCSHEQRVCTQEISRVLSPSVGFVCPPLICQMVYVIGNELVPGESLLSGHMIDCRIYRLYRGNCSVGHL